MKDRTEPKIEIDVATYNSLLDASLELREIKAKLKANKTKLVTHSEYRRLVYDSEFLSALHTAGIDAWEGYTRAVTIDDESKGEDND